MFAALFVQVFGLTKFGVRIGPTANFGSFPSAIATIYQMVIGVSHPHQSLDNTE